MVNVSLIVWQMVFPALGMGVAAGIMTYVLTKPRAKVRQR